MNTPNYGMVIYATTTMKLTQELIQVLMPSTWVKELPEDFQELIKYLNRTDSLDTFEIPQFLWILRACASGTSPEYFQKFEQSPDDIKEVLEKLRQHFREHILPIQEVKKLVDGIIRKTAN